jgi:A/G-specific adenine glycosylase
MFMATLTSIHPGIQALSEASLEDVNAMWAGLGYYRRARFLLEGAKYVVQHHNGSFPRTSKELQKIPGDLPPMDVLQPFVWTRDMQDT